jgi:hypothetical protein
LQPWRLTSNISWIGLGYGTVENHERISCAEARRRVFMDLRTLQAFGKARTKRGMPRSEDHSQKIERTSFGFGSDSSQTGTFSSCR